MTVDVTRYRETTYLKPSKKTFYPLKIPIKHHQLRHYISVAEGGLIYYLSDNDVWALYTKSRRKERIASLSFAPQCLGAGFGWICVGSLSGRCAFIDVNDSRSLGSNSGTGTGDVDELLPLNLDPQPRDPSEPMETASYSRRPAWLRAQVHTRIICGEIVNSITMYKMKSDIEGVADEDLAVISSNDKTVQLFSLRDLRTVCTLSFPVPMNHATISPDGTTLVACGDDMGAFFVRRWEIFDKPTGPYLYDKYEWAPQFRCQLPVVVQPDHCFSTAFSPSGHICTIASQFGQVTVFDMEKVWGDMEDLEAVVDTFTSSRPAPFHEESRFIELPGAIRSTAFSPNPWDLFAWAEDQGRFCVTDLRDGFRSRQMIQLDLKGKDLEGVEIAEVTEDTQSEELRALEAEVAHFRRHRQATTSNDSNTAIQSVADNIEAAARRRRLHDAAGSDSSPHELTETERQVLETLRVERLRESTEAPATPFSIHYSNSPSAQNTSIRQYMRDRNQERNVSSTAARSYNPRRQSSIVIASTNNQQASSSSSSSLSTLAPLTGNTALSTSPSRLGNTSNSQSPAPETPLSRQASNNTSNTAPSLIPTPTSADPWAATPSNLATSEQLSRLAPPSNRPGPSDASAATATADSSSSQNEDSSRDPLEQYRHQYRLLTDHNRERERIMNRVLGRDRPSRDDRNRPSPSQHPELEQARAQLVRLTAAVEADTEDVLRHLRWRVSGDRSRSRDTDGNGNEGSSSNSAAGNGLSANSNGNGATSVDPAEPTADPPSVLGPASESREQSMPTWSRERRMDAVRLAQIRRLQDRAVAAAAGMGLGAREDTLERTVMSSLIGMEREHGAAIMGMGWGLGGSELYVATEDGIFEFELNLESRREFPAIKLR